MVFISPEYHTKKLIKKYGSVFVCALFFVFLVWFFVAPVVCDLPKRYSLGEIDKEFGYTDEELLVALERAESIWESGLQKNVFEFDPRKGLPVNLIYDDRQARSDSIQHVNVSLSTLEKQRESVLARFGTLKEAYNVLSSEYEDDVKKYEKDVLEFNRTVEYWNQKKGAPKETFTLIKKEQKDLEQRQAQLELDQVQLNNLVDQLNSTAQNDQKIVTSYNRIINSFEDLHGEATLFDRASFDHESINVYEFTDENVLILSLVHELGHYLGIEHVEESTAIMHYLMRDQDLSSLAITEADIKGFELICPAENDTYFSRFKSIKNYLQTIF